MKRSHHPIRPAVGPASLRLHPSGASPRLGLETPARVGQRYR